MNSLFGTSGIRGSAKDFLTNQFCFDIGRAFANFLKKYKVKGPVAIGMDPRVSSPRIKKAVIAGLSFEQVKIFDQGISPSPAINYILIANPSLAGSLIITGSHVRKELNGIKFFAFKEEILKKHEREIEKIYHNLKEKVQFKKKMLSSSFKKENKANQAYEKMLLKLADIPYPKWKVVLDLSNGCQAKIMPKLFKKLGIKTIIINKSLKAKDFLARDTETEGSSSKLQSKVKKEKADIGAAFDPDGDRVVFIDEKGEFIPGDYSGALIAKYSKGSKIVTPINTSQVVNHIGKKIIRTKVGSPYVVEAMKKNKASFGFEANGGGIFKNIVMSRDAGSTIITILNLLKKRKVSLRKAIAVLPKFFLFRTKVDCPRKLNSIIMKKAEKAFKGIKVEKLDGLKIWKDKTDWILFRPSSNAPEFRVFAEAKTKTKAKKIGQEGINFVKSFIK